MFAQNSLAMSMCASNKHCRRITNLGVVTFLASFVVGSSTLLGLMFCPDNELCANPNFPDRMPLNGDINYCYNSTNSSSAHVPPNLVPCSAANALQMVGVVSTISAVLSVPSVYFWLRRTPPLELPFYEDSSSSYGSLQTSVGL